VIAPLAAGPAVQLVQPLSAIRRPFVHNVADQSRKEAFVQRNIRRRTFMTTLAMLSVPLCSFASEGHGDTQKDKDKEKEKNKEEKEEKKDEAKDKAKDAAEDHDKVVDGPGTDNSQDRRQDRRRDQVKKKP